MLVLLGDLELEGLTNICAGRMVVLVLQLASAGVIINRGRPPAAGGGVHFLGLGAELELKIPSYTHSRLAVSERTKSCDRITGK